MADGPILKNQKSGISPEQFELPLPNVFPPGLMRTAPDHSYHYDMYFHRDMTKNSPTAHHTVTVTVC